ncbi:MAG: hypothetical protein ABIJ09_03325 [Pseudomonadota bacterium]
MWNARGDRNGSRLGGSPGALVLSGVLSLVACPAGVAVTEGMRFGCVDDRGCVQGFRCVDKVCVVAGSVVDAAATTRDAGRSDGAALDGPAHDAIPAEASTADLASVDSTAGDGARSDGARLDGAIGDASGPDSAFVDSAVEDGAVVDGFAPDVVVMDAAVPDHALLDVPLPDSAVPDASPPDTAQADAALPDVARADAAQPDAAVPGVLLQHHQGTGSISGSASEVSFPLNPAVDPTRSLLIFSATTSSNQPVDGHTGGQLVNGGTAVRFRRGSSSASVTVDLAWTVVELDGIQVQRGTESAAAGTVVTTATLGQAIDPARAFPLFSFHLGGGNYNDNDWREATFVDDQTLRFERVQGNDPGEIDWQVVEFLPASGGQVRSGSVSLGSGDSDTTVDLAPATDPDHAFLIFSYQLSGSGTLANQLVSGRIDNASRLYFERAGTGLGVRMTWYLVEWDALRAQHGTLSFSSSQQDRSATLSQAVAPGRALAFCPSYQRQGVTDYTADDVIGTGWFTVQLADNGSNLTAHRASAAGNARVDWSVVEFR